LLVLPEKPHEKPLSRPKTVKFPFWRLIWPGKGEKWSRDKAVSFGNKVKLSRDKAV